MKPEREKKYPVVTVIGQDKKGIVAQISSFLWEKKVNIEEIQQGIMKGNFFMVMSVDIADNSIAVLSKDLEELGKKIELKINIYDQEIFTKMHKI